MDIKKDKIPNTVAKFIFYFVKDFKLGILILVATAIGYSICQSLFPYFIKLISNTLYQNAANNKFYIYKLRYMIFLLCAAWAVMQIIANIQGFSVYKIIPEFKSKIKLTIFEFILNYRLEY